MASVQPRVEFGEATDLGWRHRQEDRAHCVLGSDYTYLAIYDGHGSDQFAQHCKEQLHDLVTNDEAWAAGDVATALKNGFLKEDEQLIKVTTDGNEGGTTASVVVIRNCKLFSANVGDSRIILGEAINSDGSSSSLSADGNAGQETGVQHVEQDEEWRAWRLTRDHVPTDAVENKRIVQSGGQIFYGRVLGVLNITRALGDHVFKFPFNRDVVSQDDVKDDFLSAAPHTNVIELEPHRHQFAIVASDGLWNSVGELAAVRIVAEAKNGGKTPQDAADALIAAASKNREGSGGDNVTAIVAYFSWPS